MNRFFSRLLNIRPNEGRKVLLLLGMFFLFITGTAWAETIIESSYYYLAGVSQISQVFTLHAITSMIATAIYTAFVDRVSNQKLLIAVCGIAMLAICAALILLDVNPVLGYTVLYVLVRAVRTSFVIHWWNYASDFYDTRSAKRIVPVITAASRFAIIVASFTIPLLNSFLSATGIILLWVATLFAIALLSWVMKLVVRDPNENQSSPKKDEPRKKERSSYLQNIREGFQYVSSSNYLRWIALSIFLMVIVFALLNYQGGLIFKYQFTSRAEITNFIGYLNGITSLLMLPVQLFLFSRIVAKIGVGNANLIFPAGTFLISGAILFSPLSLFSGALAHFDRNTFRYSAQEASNNLLYNAVPVRVKGRARAFIDGVVLPVALLVSSALLEFGKSLPAEWFLPVLLGLPAAAYLLCGIVIRKSYSRAMVALLEQEDYASLIPSSENVELSVDPDTLNILSKRLADSNNDEVTLLIARIIAESAGIAALPALEEKAQKSEARVRAGIIDTLVSIDLRNDAIRQFYTYFMNDADEQVRLSAFVGLHHWAGNDDPQLLELALRLLQDSNLDIRTQALAGLLSSSNPNYIQSAEETLHEMLNDPDPHVQARVLDAIGQTNNPRFMPVIIKYLNASADEVRLQAMLTLEIFSTPVVTEATATAIFKMIQRLMADPVERIRLATLTMLERTRSPRAYPLIAGALNDSSLLIRETAAEILVRIGEVVAPILSLQLEVNTIQQPTMLKAVLCRINRRQFGGWVETQIQEDLKNIYTHHTRLEAIRPLPDLPGVLVLRTMVNEINQNLIDKVFYLLSAYHGEKAVRTIEQSLSTEIARKQANASEALESLVGLQQARLIMPLFDRNAASVDLIKIGMQEWGLRQNNLIDTLQLLVTDPEYELLRAFGTYASGEIAAELKPIPQLPPAPLPPPPPVENRRQRRVNPLDKLLGEETPAEPKPVPPPEPPPAAPIPVAAPVPDSLSGLLSHAEILKLIELAQSDPSLEVQAAAHAALRVSGMRSNEQVENKLMASKLSIIERIIFLKQVSFFQNMTIDQLKVLASVCEEETVPQNTRIFNEADPGGVMYVVVNGRVGIEREGERKGSIVRLANIEARSYFGEMSLFDKSPRNASALALQDSLLLKLSHEPLIALIRQHPDMSIELINVLSLRMREANDQIARLTRAMPRQLHQVYDKLAP